MGLSLGLSKHWWPSTATRYPPSCRHSHSHSPHLYPQLKGQRNFLPKVATQAPFPSELQESHSDLETTGFLMGQKPSQ